MEAAVSVPSGTTEPSEKLFEPVSEGFAVKITSLTPLAGVSALTESIIYSEPGWFQAPYCLWERKA